MTGVAWTAIGLLAATLFGMLYYLGGRIDKLASRIDALGARLDARIDSLSANLIAHIERHAG